MRNKVLPLTALALVFPAAATPQAPSSQPNPPLYQVTIVSRTTKAINYGYLSTPTRIGFRGTPVAHNVTGQATVDPGRGATLLDIRLDHLPAAQRFGGQYLTYVVWAISPDGRAQSVGELILDGSDEARLKTSTPLQTFALIVTAEPYYAVSRPSDVVVAENVITRDTVGNVQEVNATYELLPRAPYTYDPAAQSGASAGRLVSPEQHEAITALYQALNAIQIAQAQGADRHAPEQLSRARSLYNKARTFPVHLSKRIVSMAREATQIAEDSRAIAVKRAEAEKAAMAQQQAVEPQPPAAPEPASERSQPAAHAEPGPQPVDPPVQAPIPRNTRSRTAQERPVIPADAADSPPPVEVDHRQFLHDRPEAGENRRRILAALPRSFEVLDSARGIVITIPAHAATSASANYSAIAAAIRPYRNLHVKVEAHADTDDSAGETERDAERVRRELVEAGASPAIIIARGYGNVRPRTSNATPAGRAENRRVEIVITGDAIGTLPVWDRTYTLRPAQR
jgi:flagellar motor protein MotB